jgi:hypothetical protein
MTLSKEEQEYLDEKFKEFKQKLWSKLKIPAIGVAILFAGLMSAFASYTYITAKADVAQAQVEFYQNMIAAQHEVTDLKEEMIGKFNSLMEEAITQKSKLDDIVVEEEERSFVGPPPPTDPFAEELKERLDKAKKKEEQAYKIDPRQYIQRSLQ